MMAPDSTEMSLQQEERQARGGGDSLGIGDRLAYRGLEWDQRVEDPPERGKGFIPVALAGFAGPQVAVLGQGCKGALASWNRLCSPDGASLVGVWLGVKKGWLVVLPYKPRP